MKFVKIILKDLKKGENVDGYLALILGLICSFIAIFDVSFKYVFTAISTVLTLLALGILIDRKNVQKVSKLLENIELKNSEALAQRNKEFFYAYIFETINNAKQEICLLVRSGGTLKSISQELEEAINRGCQVRIILCARNQATIDTMAFRGHMTTDRDEIISEIEATIRKLKNLKEKIKKSKLNLLKVREIKYLPPVGLSISDPDLIDGKLFALLVSFRSHSRSGPSILLDNRNSPDLFNYFKNQFNNYWDAADEIAELK